jgi:hypothetical protein
VWLAIFTWSFATVSFVNDHFDRISRGRQILAYGEHPFAHFRDPGYFMTLYVSAAAQAVTGGGLLGEAFVTSASIATAGALTYSLAVAAAGSWPAGLVATALTLLVPARHYDYDKVLFYMLGLACCWRYGELPTRGRLVAAGLVTTIAGTFRYDNGLYVAAACVAAIAVRRWRDWPSLAADLSTYLAVVVVSLLPAVAFVHSTAGLPEAVRQITTYAAREGQRSELFSLPPLTRDRTSMTYVAVVAAPPLALAALVVRRRILPLAQQALVVAAAVLCMCVGLFVLRDPIAARLGAAVPPAAVLATCLAPARAPSRRLLVAALACLVAAAVVYPSLLWRAVRSPVSVPRRLAAVGTVLAHSPPETIYMPDGGRLQEMANYLRSCTAADAHVLVTWFAPEVYFFAERGFAGGMAVFLGTHWSSEDDQERAVAQLEAQKPPLVLVQAATRAEFEANFSRIAAHLDAHYRAAAEGNRSEYRALVRRDLGEVPLDSTTGFPCPQPQ